MGQSASNKAVTLRTNHCFMTKDERKVYNDSYNKKLRANNPEKLKGYKLKAKFGMNINQYNELFKKQNGCCLICKKHQISLSKALAVDHCHQSNKIRGLLCSSCNIGIGHLQDNVKVLQAAIDYLQNAE